MASTRTSHLKLNTWIGKDGLLREEMNENFTKIDAATKALETKIETNTGGNGGILTFATLNELQAALPNGSSSPVWVTAENTWYHWDGNTQTPPTDTTPPVVTIIPSGGSFTTTQQVTLTANETATIYYTLNGDTPTVNSTVYTGAITVSATQTIKVIAKDTTGNISSPVSATFTKTVVDPGDTTAPVITASVPAGTYTSVQSVTLTANETADIFYTLDGTTPTTASTKYSGAISIPSTKTLKFFGKDTTGNSSAVITIEYTINIPTEIATATVVDYDPFIKPNSTTSLGTTLGGKSWSSSGVYGVLDNAPYIVSGSGDTIATFDSGYADGEIEWTVASPGGSGTPRYIFRAQSNTQYFALQGSTLYRFNPNFINVGTTSFGSTVVGDKIKVVLKGSSIKIYRNDVLGLDIVDTTFVTATKYGFGSSTVGTTFGNIKFSAYAADTFPPLVSLTVPEGSYPTAVTTGFKTSETADIYYTTDGTTPTISSTKYTDPVTFTSTTTLKYFAKDTAGNSSPIATKVFTITTPSVIVSDTFTRADDTTTLGNAETGQSWIPARGTWGITGNKGTCIASSDAIAVVDSGVSNAEVSFVRTGNMRLVYRFESLSSYFMIQGADLYSQYKGTLVKILTGTVAPVDGNTVKVVISGTEHKFYVNDVLSFTYNSSQGLYATKHGAGVSGPSSSIKFDDFKIKG